MRPRYFAHFGKTANVHLSPFAANARQGRVIGCPQNAQNLIQLVNVYVKPKLQSLPLNSGFPPKSSAKIHPTDHMSTASVSVTCFRVVAESQHDLWSSIPASRNVLCHEPSISRFHQSTRQPKIANLELTIGIHQQIPWFQIAMQHICRVDILESTAYLVYKILVMGVSQWLL